MKKILAPLAAGTLLAGAAVLAATAVHAAPPPAPAKLIVADAKTTHHLNLYVAQELGLFGKRNLEVQITEAKDLAAARDLVVSGQADVFWACPTVGISAIANGAPFKVISQVKRPCTSVLVVPRDSPIESYAGLKGKKIAGISPTCEAVIAYSKKAREAGGEFLLEKLAGGAAIAALEARAVDGAILEEPHVSIAELKGYKVILRDAASSIPCRTINARNAALKENLDGLRRLVEAVKEANAIILKDPKAKRIVEIAVKYTGAPPEAIVHGNHRLEFTEKIDEPGLTLLAEELLAQKNIKELPGDRLYAPEFKGVTWGK